MNPLIDTLNASADHVLGFAWPMLWQSSLLIGLLFALDLLLRRKLRPAVRYALWLVVLVKLVLPPSLSAPTGAGWWLRPAKATPARSHPAAVVVTHDTMETPLPPVVPTPVFVPPPPPRLTPAAWALAGMAAVNLGLLAWVLARWCQVARDARRAAAAPGHLCQQLPELRRPLRLRLTEQPQSPAVCGLFRPVILVPRSLVEHLAPEQLRAVLLHELYHLRRGDVWVNCAQGLLQIAYWWHPLLWLANARIRRVREEAVDDAVMLALSEDAEAYAPTLLEVAKLALHRPLASLGLVGILESRSALRQRIERLMDFRPPRKAGLTLGSTLTVLAFAALAVPMGEAPAKHELLSVPNPNVHTNLVHTSQGRQAILHKLESIRLARVSFNGLPLSEVVRNLADEARKGDPEMRGINFVIASPELAKTPWEASVDSLTGLPKPAKPAEAMDPVSIVITIQSPLTNICLGDVLDAIVKVAPEPIKYSIEDYAVVFSARTGHESPPLYVRTFKVDPNALLDALHLPKAPVGTNDSGAIAPALLAFFAKGGVDLDPVRNPGKALFYGDRRGMLVVRATMQDLDLIEAIIQMLNNVPPQINIKARFAEVPPEDAKALGFDWYLGNVVLTNGANGGHSGIFPAPVAPNSTNQLGTIGLYPSQASPFTFTGILTDPQFRVTIKALQQRSGAEIIAQPEVTTLSGRQAQMKVCEVQTMVMGINERALTPPGITITNGNESSLYVTQPMEFGPVLDVIPSVLPDDWTIALTVIPTVTEFLGYEDAPTNRVAVYANGKKKWVVPPRPKFRVQQMSASVRVLDGLTVVLGGPASETITMVRDSVPLLGDLPLVGGLFRSQSKTVSKKNLLVFITPTLIDPAGNRIHPEGTALLGTNAIPPRSSR